MSMSLCDLIYLVIFEFVLSILQQRANDSRFFRVSAGQKVVQLRDCIN